MVSIWLPERASIRRERGGAASPRCIFASSTSRYKGRTARPWAPAANQTVEIALGPKGAFENGNVGTLTRRVPADRVVSAVPPRRGRPKPPRKPWVAELLRKAIEWRRQLDAGEVRSQAEIARREGLTRARVTQVLGLLRLAPEIQTSWPCRSPSVGDTAGLRPDRIWIIGSSGHPLVITQNGKPAGVLLSPAAIDELSERQQFLAAVQEGMADEQAGQSHTTDEVFAAAGRRIDAIEAE